MKPTIVILVLAALLLPSGSVWSETQKKSTASASSAPGTTCVRDHDNDGIPNRLDPDWQRPQDGTGYQNHRQNRNSFADRSQNRRCGRSEWNSRFGGGACDGTGPHGRRGRRGSR